MTTLPDKATIAMHARLTRVDNFVKVEASGAAGLDSFLAMIKSLGVQTRANGDRRVLVNLMAVEGELNFTGHYLVGEYVARHLSHLTRLASVVPSDKITRTSEKVARAQGVQLSVFDTEVSALAWLLASDPPGTQGEPLDSTMMDPVRAVFWDTFRRLFPPHAQAIQLPNGNLVISWSVADEPHAVWEMSTPITVRFEPTLLQEMYLATPDQREHIAASQDSAFRAGLLGYDPYAAVPQARVIVLG